MKLNLIRIWFSSLIGFIGLITTPALANSPRPNIVLILADDLGWKDVGYQGSDFYETPSIDRLAADGVIFTDGYAAAGNCAPSRACLHSGNYTPRHGVYAVGRTDRGPKSLQRLIPIPNKSGLANENITIADALNSAGYATGLFGKWHLDGKEGCDPTEQGFDIYYDPKKENPNSSKGKIQSDPKGIFSITKAAESFMATNVALNKPFFCFVSHHAIHSAQEARQATFDHFAAKARGAQHDNVLYAACTKDFDDGVGQLLAKVDALGIASNTLVILTSDNGGVQQSSQEPLRGNKGCYYEGGIREPFIIRWPGVAKPGTSIAAPVINVDLYPTFLAVAGAPVSAGKVLDGENLLPLLSGKPLARTKIFWDFPGYLDNPVIRGRDPVFRTRPVSVVRKGDWKLHLYLEEWQLDGGRATLETNNAVELYNLRDDIGERNNLAQKNPDKCDELLNDLLAWKESLNAPVPVKSNPAYYPNSPEPVKKRGKGNKMSVLENEE
jgi:arylsulfatase A-like enzyme